MRPPHSQTPTRRAAADPHAAMAQDAERSDSGGDAGRAPVEARGHGRASTGVVLVQTRRDPQATRGEVAARGLELVLERAADLAEQLTRLEGAGALTRRTSLMLAFRRIAVLVEADQLGPPPGPGSQRGHAARRLA